MLKTDHLVFVFMQSSLADLPLKNFYRFVLPVKVGLSPHASVGLFVGSWVDQAGVKFESTMLH
jgi:hypothetical protein